MWRSPAFRFTLLLILGSFLLAGCASTAPSGPPAEGEQTGLVVSAETLAEWLAASEGEEIIVLHVDRDRSGYDAGHVPGAHFLPLSTLVTNRDGLVNELPSMDALGASLRAVGVSPSSRVVLYDGLGGLAAARAFFALDATGHARTAILDGGFAAWERGGHPVSAESTPPPAPGTFEPRLNDDRLATAEEVADRLDDAQDGEIVFADARPHEQYTGETSGTDVERPGHIPGAVSLYWQEDLRDDGTLRSLDALRDRYAAHGAASGEPLVAYCRTGMQASHTYFVARLLGLDASMYDGSYLEWSNQTSYPVTRDE